MSNRVKKSLSILTSYAASGSFLSVEFLVKSLYNDYGFKVFASLQG
jgi:hypothetical protein